MATRISCIISHPHDLDNYIAGVDSLFGWIERKAQIIGEIEDGASYYVEGDDYQPFAYGCCRKREGRRRYLTTDPDKTITNALSLPHCSKPVPEFWSTLDRRCLPPGEHDFASITGQNLPLEHRPSSCLSQLSSSPSLAGRRQKGHPDSPWSGGATAVTEAVTALENSLLPPGPPRRRSRPRAPMGPSQSRRPGPLHFGCA